MLRNDDDLDVMFELVSSSGLNRVKVSVFDAGSTSGGGGGSNSGCGGAGGDQQLAILRRDWKMDVDKQELEWVPSFCMHKETVLLSAGWSALIREVMQKFAGGVVEFRNALAKYAMHCGFEYDFVKNDQERVTAVCREKKSGCPWIVHGRVDKLSRFFYIRELNNVHNCDASALKVKHSRASSSFIGKLILEEVRSRPQKRPVDVLDDMKRLYGLSISYKRAWTGVEKSKAEVFGDYSTSFDELRWWVEAARCSNPDSVFDIEFDPQTKRFVRMFVAFRASIYGFNHCRPMLFLDGTFLKARHKGCLLAASAKDGNKGLFPICFAIVDAETNVSWSWFLGKLRDILSNERDIVFFSDRNDGICSGIANIFPRSPHSYCLYHLKMNLRHALSGLKGGFKEHLVSLFSMCAHAPNEKMFDDLIADLKSQGKGRVITFLSRLPKEHWACAFFPGKRYGEMCSNLAECFNNWIQEERHLPVTQLVDRIRVKMMENIAKRSQVAAKWNFFICPNMNKELENSFHVSKSWNVKRSTTDVFEVLSDPSVMVNLSNQTCSCFDWQFRCFPCCHAVCAIYNSGKDLQNYVDPYYMVETYREVYLLPIYPIPTLGKPAPGGNEDTILPPLSRKPSGRPRKKRLRSNGEKIRPIQCGRCGKVGRHNRKTCKEDLRAAD
ncbi:hypothetical protein RHGRI_031088 [Rhododendron griersonianum]|uniref:SWIM-type domain-containing protein n=1 Tax=Rhododendron griersonianum TaxID=479676 RepID=A0AAV6I6Z7_9ERIC|nr:hypothetical protein RHGRI_031088 [Rhododendron griersonianum]